MNGRKVKYLFPVLLLILALLTQYKSEAALQYAQNVNSLIDFNGLSINTSTLTAYDSKTPVNNGYFFKNAGVGVDFSPVSGVFFSSPRQTSVFPKIPHDAPGDLSPYRSHR